MNEYLQCVSAARTEYPLPPVPMCEISADGLELPLQCGVYFIWNRPDGCVAYVGKSEVLRQRARLGHEKARQGEWVSWIVAPIFELEYWEAYYIGICQPYRNFGESKAWLQRRKKSMPAADRFLLNERKRAEYLRDKVQCRLCGKWS